MIALRRAVIWSTLILILIAFALSWEKIHGVALSGGIHPRLALAYPFLVEGFTILSLLAAFLRHGRPGAWYPWLVGLVAFAFSLACNSFSASIPPEVTRGVPVVVGPLLVHMLLIILDAASLRDRERAAELEDRAAREAARERAEIDALEAWLDAPEVDVFDQDQDVPEGELAPVSPAPARRPRAPRSAQNFLALARRAPTEAARQQYMELARRNGYAA